MVEWNFSDWNLAGISRRNFGWKFWNGPRLGESDRFLVGKHESEALGGAGGDVVGRSKRGCYSIKWTDLGLANVWFGCWLGSVDNQLLRGAETKVVRSYTPRRPH